VHAGPISPTSRRLLGRVEVAGPSLLATRRPDAQSSPPPQIVHRHLSRKHFHRHRSNPALGTAPHHDTEVGRSPPSPRQLKAVRPWSDDRAASPSPFYPYRMAVRPRQFVPAGGPPSPSALPRRWRFCARHNRYCSLPVERPPVAGFDCSIGFAPASVCTAVLTISCRFRSHAIDVADRPSSRSVASPKPPTLGLSRRWRRRTADRRGTHHGSVHGCRGARSASGCRVPLTHLPYCAAPTPTSMSKSPVSEMRLDEVAVRKSSTALTNGSRCMPN
jgi:hypothetical protein